MTLQITDGQKDMFIVQKDVGNLTNFVNVRNAFNGFVMRPGLTEAHINEIIIPLAIQLGLEINKRR